MIGCANVLSDLYAMGVVECDNMLMLLAQSMDMNKDDAKIVSKELIRGFNDQAKIANTAVTGGQSVRNPWPIIGGVASSVCLESQFLRPENAVVGDVLVLTKPLGTQLAVNCNQWMYMEEKWKKIENVIEKDEVRRAIDISVDSMIRLNKTGAMLMHKYGSHAATDVTGFGILGHSNNLARNQLNKLKFSIHTMPIIRSMRRVDEHIKIFNLMQGLSSETSGGLLICLPKDKAIQFCKEIEEIDNAPAWIIGDVVENTDQPQNYSQILPNVNVIEI